MARKNERERASGRSAPSGARKAGGSAKKAGATKAAAKRGARKSARKNAGAGARAGASKAAARKTTGTRKPAARKQGGAKAAARKSEARDTARVRTTRRAPAAGRRAAQARGRKAGAARRGQERGRAARARGRGGLEGGYSASTRRALWIESPDQRAERPGQTLATRDHDVIVQWAEERQAVPATVSGTEHDGRPGVLRFDFPNFGGGGRLRPVDWDEWFETFDQRNLVFLFQEQMKDGRQSNLFRLDSPDREEG
jgi:hypothetical protein